MWFARGALGDDDRGDERGEDFGEFLGWLGEDEGVREEV